MIERLKKIWIYIMIVATIFILFLTFSIVHFNFEAETNKKQATLLLNSYSSNIELKLFEHFNYTNALSDYSTNEKFNDSAKKIMQNPACLFVQYMQNTTIKYAYPASGYWADDIGKDILQLDPSYTLGKLTKKYIVEGPVTQENQKIFLTILPLFEKGNSDIDIFVGEIIVALKGDIVLNEFMLDDLVAYGYEYNLWRINPLDGHKSDIKSSSAAVDFSKALETQFHLPTIWKLNIIPTEGWVNIMSIFALLAMTAISTLSAAFIMYFYHKKKNLQNLAIAKNKVDDETGFLRNESLLITLDKMAAQNTPFALFYIVFSDYTRVEQLCEPAQKKELLEHIINCFNDYVKSKHTVARIADNTFILLLSDNAELSSLENLRKGLYIELMYKLTIAGDKILLTPNITLTRYPTDAPTPTALLTAAAQKFYAPK